VWLSAASAELLFSKCWTGELQPMGAPMNVVPASTLSRPNLFLRCCIARATPVEGPIALFFQPSKETTSSPLPSA
jgi:hypothetical protein